jgi:hypothetical protein
MTLLPARRLSTGAHLYRKGRRRVLVVNGMLYCGGSIFLFLNLLDYFRDRGAPFRLTDLLRIAAFLTVSVAIGYLYGRLIWRQLDCLFGPGPVVGESTAGSPSIDEPVQ